MNRLFVGAAAAMLLLGTAGLRAPAIAAESTGLPPQNTITMNFQNVDIPVLAKFISEITGRNFIIDESVRGKVTSSRRARSPPSRPIPSFNPCCR